MTEEWRDIEGYEGLYQVSNMGRIKSVSTTRVNINGVKTTAKERIRRTYVHHNGYVMIQLFKDGKTRRFSVHRLVAKAFIPNVDATLQVDHINGIKTDNRLDNLRFVTPQENTDNKMRLGNIVHESEHHEQVKEPDDLPDEIWLPVVDFEGLYEVSNKGRVKSVEKTLVNKNGIKRRFSSRLMNPVLKKTGYYAISLSRDGKKTYRFVHRLVADAFLGKNPDPKNLLIDHINGVKTDNRQENLRYVTQEENLRSARELGLIDATERSRISRENAYRIKLNKIRSEPVIRSDGKWFESSAAAERELGCSRDAVRRVIRGEAKSVYGYTFKLANKTA